MPDAPTERFPSRRKNLYRDSLKDDWVLDVALSPKSQISPMGIVAFRINLPPFNLKS